MRDEAEQETEDYDEKFEEEHVDHAASWPRAKGALFAEELDDASSERANDKSFAAVVGC